MDRSAFHRSRPWTDPHSRVQLSRAPFVVKRPSDQRPEQNEVELPFGSIPEQPMDGVVRVLAGHVINVLPGEGPARRRLLRAELAQLPKLVFLIVAVVGRGPPWHKQ